MYIIGHVYIIKKDNYNAFRAVNKYTLCGKRPNRVLVFAVTDFGVFRTPVLIFARRNILRVSGWVSITIPSVP